MKKALALMLVLLVGGTAFIAGTLWYNADKIGYRTDIVKYAGLAKSSDGIIAVYGSQVTKIVNSNVERLIWALTIGEGKRRLQLTGRECNDDCVNITFGEKLTIAVWPLSKETDEVFIVFRAPGKTRNYTLKGYNTMEWLIKIISPEGYREPNELIETQKI